MSVIAKLASSLNRRDEKPNQELVKLGSLKPYAEDAFTLLNEQLLNSPVNQLPSYAEKALTIVTDNNREILGKTLVARLDDVDIPTKRRRIEIVLKKLQG